MSNCIIKEEFKSRQEQANIDNGNDWLGTEKMLLEGIKASRPICCIGYSGRVKKTPAFDTMQHPRIHC